MHNNFREKMHLFFLHRIPLVATLILLFLFYIPLNSLELNYFRPEVGIICVYYWTSKRGYMFGYVSAFIVGFLMDTYSSTPLGVNILMMMLLVFITQTLDIYFQTASFGSSWFVFAFAGLLLTVVKWLLISVYFNRFVPVAEIMINLLSTIMFYPLVSSINIYVQNLLPQEHINE